MSFSSISYKSLTCIELELTSKCALKCPRCSRTEYKGVYSITDMPLDLIKKRIHSDSLKKFSDIILSGNYGDPIYHDHFLEVLKYLKSQNYRIEIETNASGKDTNFWKIVTSILDDKDVITFSVDGLKDTNSIYRINSKWDSIQQAMEIACKSRVQTEWKFIVFKHNQHQIEEAMSFAKSIGISEFVIVKSKLFGEIYLNKDGIDPLKPEEKWLPPSPFKNSSNQKFKILPKCLTKEKHFISAEGYYFPCCWMAENYYINKSLFTKQEMQSLSLHNHSLKEILQNETLKTLEKSWKNVLSAPSPCIKNCESKKTYRNNSRCAHKKTWHTLN
ncbi:MAG: radical SAM protein [Oligoflexia bacterium]|nr:radical SAM protein [Oligoflexia bacterium]